MSAAPAEHAEFDLVRIEWQASASYPTAETSLRCEVAATMQFYGFAFAATN
jgi:hypothetical protein